MFFRPWAVINNFRYCLLLEPFPPSSKSVLVTAQLVSDTIFYALGEEIGEKGGRKDGEKGHVHGGYYIYYT